MDVIAVDDNPAGLELLRMLLESAGHRVRTAGDVAGGLGLLGADPVPSVVVTDLLLGPAREDGYHLITTIRADPRYDAVAIVALTGVTSADDLGRARLAGADVCLGKPFDIDAFLATLEDVSSERKAPAGDRPTREDLR